MPIDFEDSNDRLRTIRLSGRLDHLGTDEISLMTTGMDHIVAMFSDGSAAEIAVTA
ncbi:MAG: hypothetical protein K9K38_06470 [Rhodoferax sp.]|nr:hypothetical protein [Rhodoferax sp.]